MIGIIVATHGNFGETLIDAAESIIGSRVDGLLSISINLTDNADNLRKKIKDAIKKVDKHEGVLILTDMFGGTPSNLSYSFLDEGCVEVLSGVNLPILIKAAHLRSKVKLGELAVALEAFGKKSIALASGILKPIRDKE